MRILQHIALAISSTLYTGFLPGWILRKPGKAGGTAGALCGLLMQCLLLEAHWIIMINLVVATFLIGCIAVPPAEQLMLEKWGSRRRHTGEEVTSDFNETNIDEVHGQLLAGLPLWLLDVSPDARIWLLVASFVLFRIFDTLKPSPIRELERATKGTFYGVMIDDTGAALIVVVWFISPLAFFF